MTLQEEAEQLAKEEYCEGCKGQPLLKYDTACTETCEGFKADVEQTLRDWATEDAGEEKLLGAEMADAFEKIIEPKEPK